MVVHFTISLAIYENAKLLHILANTCCGESFQSHHFSGYVVTFHTNSMISGNLSSLNFGFCVCKIGILIVKSNNLLMILRGLTVMMQEGVSSISSRWPVHNRGELVMLSLGQRDAPYASNHRPPLFCHLPTTMLLEHTDPSWWEFSLSCSFILVPWPVTTERRNLQITEHPNNVCAGSHLLSQVPLQGIFQMNMVFKWEKFGGQPLRYLLKPCQG